MDKVTEQYMGISLRLKAARTALRASKKGNGKKADQTKEARRAVRALKKERLAFVAANPGFTPPARATRGRTNDVAASIAAAQAREAEKAARDQARTNGETVAVWRGGQLHWVGEQKAPPVAAPAPEELPAAEPPPAVGSAAPTAAVAAVMERKALTADILASLVEAGAARTAAQVAGAVGCTPKQAADALGRLAKEGKVVKATRPSGQPNRPSVVFALPLV